MERLLVCPLHQGQKEMAEKEYAFLRTRVVSVGYSSRKAVTGYWDEGLHSDGAGGGNRFVWRRSGWGYRKPMSMGYCPLM